MSRSTRRSWWDSWTPTGAVIVSVMSAALLIAVIAVVVLALRGQEVPEVLDRLLQALLVGVPSLTARTRQDPAAVVEQPASVSATAEASS